MAPIAPIEVVWNHDEPCIGSEAEFRDVVLEN